MNDNTMEERLKHLLGLVIEFVKFAEAKNAALLAVNSALIIGFLQIWFGSDHHPFWLKPYLFCALPLMALSVLFVFISFLPLKTFPILMTQEHPHADDNLIFFGDIAKYNASDYLRALSETPIDSDLSNSRYELNLSGQVIINSRIALRKYNCFTWALWLTIYGLVTPPIGLSAWIIVKFIKKFWPNG